MLGGFSPASVNKNNAAEVRYTSYQTRKKKKNTDQKSMMQKPSLKVVKKKKKNPYNLRIGDNVMKRTCTCKRVHIFSKAVI